MVVQCTFVLRYELGGSIMSTKLSIEKTWLGDRWCHLKYKNGFVGPDRLFIRRATKGTNNVYSVFHQGSHISNHHSISKAKEAAEALL